MNDEKLLQMIRSCFVDIRCLGLKIMCSRGYNEVIRIFDTYGRPKDVVVDGKDVWRPLHDKVIPNVPQLISKTESGITYIYCGELNVIFSDLMGDLEVWRYLSHIDTGKAPFINI